MNESEPTDAQLQALASQSQEALIKWWCELNQWGWPRELPGDPYRGLPKDERRRVITIKSSRTRIHNMIRNYLEMFLDEKPRLKYWNTKRLHHMTEGQFEEWWEREGRNPLDEILNLGD